MPTRCPYCSQYVWKAPEWRENTTGNDAGIFNSSYEWPPGPTAGLPLTWGLARGRDGPLPPPTFSHVVPHSDTSVRSIEWPPAPPISPRQDTDSSPTASSDVAAFEDRGRATRAPYCLNAQNDTNTLRTQHNSPIDTDPRPCEPSADTYYAPPMGGSVTITYPNRSQDPPGMSNFIVHSNIPWLPHYHAVEEAAAQLNSRDLLPVPADPPSHPAATWPRAPDSSPTSQNPIPGVGSAHTPNVVVDPVSQWQIPSASAPNRRRRASRVRITHVICEKCQKLMCKQSYKRHTREVHQHIRRPKPKGSR